MVAATSRNLNHLNDVFGAWRSGRFLTTLPRFPYLGRTTTEDVL
jgi:hypothetical protein